MISQCWCNLLDLSEQCAKNVNPMESQTDTKKWNKIYSSLKYNVRFSQSKINQGNETWTVIDLVSGNTFENSIIIPCSSSATDRDFVGHHAVHLVDGSSEGTQMDLLGIDNELWSQLSHFSATTKTLSVYSNRSNEQETFHRGRNATIAVICLITQRISSWSAFWDCSPGVLSSLAVVSQLAPNCHLSRTSPLSVFEMTTTSFHIEHLYSQSLSCSTTLLRCFMCSGSVVTSKVSPHFCTRGKVSDG